MNRPSSTSPRQQAELRQTEEAMRVAKGVQAPGQTKEQTKLIAKGIEKGIALYKMQQKAKQRERDKARKKASRLAVTDDVDLRQSIEVTEDFYSAKPALLTAAAVFGLLALFMGLRLLPGVPLLQGPVDLPVYAEVLAMAVAGALGAWMLMAARRC